MTADTGHVMPMIRPAGRVWLVVAAGVAAFVCLYSFSTAQTVAQPAVSPPQQSVPTPFVPLTAEQLERLVAPISLYPDPLVAQILMAATYPLEVVKADRWLQMPTNAALKEDALTSALLKQSWDPSIKSLIPFPQILHMMDTNLDWTEQLGEAFLAQQADVMDAIQRLRRRAQTAGSLVSTPQQLVSTEGQEIMIEPASPEIVYVPAYNPWCIYGDWPYPNYPPFYFGTWAGYCEPAESIIAFGVSFYPFPFWAWGRFEWRHHQIRIDHDRFQQFHAGHEPPSGVWEHDPAHRHGVPYRDPATAARFLGPDGTKRGYRGYSSAPAVMPSVKPSAPLGGHGPAYPTPSLTAPQRSGPPAFQSYGPGSQVRGEAARGLSSRMAPIAPAPPITPAPSFRAAPAMPSFHGGGGRR